MTRTSPFTIMNQVGVFTEHKSPSIYLFCLILKTILYANVNQLLSKIHSIIINYKSEGKMMYADIV